MNFPLVSVVTKDNHKLHGLLIGSSRDKLYLHIHGTASNFYYNSHWLQPLAENLEMIGWSFLNTNNRGAEVCDIYKDSPFGGAANEIFEECVFDIDAWFRYAIKQGYKTIVLSGHSLGTEKVVYYLSKGYFKDEVKAVILLGFSDSFGSNELYMSEKNVNYLPEAQKLVNEGKPEQLLTDLFAHAGYLPQTARSYLNFFSPGSELSQALPLRHGDRMELFSHIKVPILGVIGDRGEFTVIPISEAVDLLKRNNSQAEVFQITGSDHEYVGKELTMVKIVTNFINQKLSEMH